jgi:hypothetical protein
MSSVHFNVEGTACFVPHPEFRGLWVKVPVAVAFVPCAACKSKRKEPCKGQLGRHRSSTHVDRLDAYMRFKKKHRAAFA